MHILMHMLTVTFLSLTLYISSKNIKLGKIPSVGQAPLYIFKEMSEDINMDFDPRWQVTSPELCSLKGSSRTH